ncbi:RNA methyltransferase family protein [Mycobacterium xenopi 4042]|uniref:RNA methyltransferase family protein n=1 Tax=Mycobacterium xenopi 4042 TaxID=1299334 RepID=X8AQH1_MYCXE|nr:RNA methyltransferase family protein [Mycobacterium xenopi 4042]
MVQALPKSERSELAVELATEAGADAFLAWQAARCVARWDGARPTRACGAGAPSPAALPGNRGGHISRLSTVWSAPRR